MWKIIEKEPDYEVSDEGQIRNINTGYIKSLRYDRYGYLRVTLYPSGKTYTVHRLVEDAFLVKKDNQEQVNHKNGIKDDNHSSNLEWGDCSYNSKHRSSVLYPDQIKGSANPMAILNEESVRRIKYGDWQYLSNKRLSEILGVNPEQIRRVKKGDRWGHI